ncbi:hypothetical protein ABVK25_002986 [Lepraria finkii]|uniref:AIM24 family protein n=1 Tax=Lepraria finkii TaxID=1340010 RepID=A0ABR4BFH6_9LECA
MASAVSASTSGQLSRVVLDEDGFVVLKGSEFGRRVRDFAGKGFPLKSAEGLDFCKGNILNDDRVRGVIESEFPRCGLGAYTVLDTAQRKPGFFLYPGEPARQALVVQLWSNASRVLFYKGSHLGRSLQPTNGDRLLEISTDRLPMSPVELVFEDGGLTILDGRLCFQIIHGFALTLVFAAPERLGKFAKMILPDSPDLKAQVDRMTTAKIGFNYEYKS